MSDDRIFRAKDAVREFREWVGHDNYTDDQNHILFSFAYWLEGQDLWTEDENSAGPCRYHVVPSERSSCPFGSDELEERQAELWR